MVLKPKGYLFVGYFLLMYVGGIGGKFVARKQSGLTRGFVGYFRLVMEFVVFGGNFVVFSGILCNIWLGQDIVLHLPGSATT